MLFARSEPDADDVPLHNSRGWALVAAMKYDVARKDFADAIRSDRNRRKHTPGSDSSLQDLV